MTDMIYYGVDGAWHHASLDVSPSRSGYMRLVEPDGSVVSMQPGGGYGVGAANGTRPAGTDGPWEQAMKDGSFLTYTTDVTEPQRQAGLTSASYPVMVLKR